MFDKFIIGSAADSLKISDPLSAYSRVTLKVADGVEYTAGTDSGKELISENPFGTQKMANDMLARINGFSYQTYTATGAILDPAAEIGDAVQVKGTYGGIYSVSKSYGKMIRADVSAPGSEEIDESAPYKSHETRKVERQFIETRAQLKIQADKISAEVSARIEQGDELTSRLDIQSDQISARVTKTGGSSSSFGWDLLDDSWTIKANNTTVFQITKSGAEVRGKITALSGKIGGFDIQSDYLSYNNQVWNGTNSRGIYIGVNGIQCGSKASGVQITPDGKLYAENGYFRGNVSAGQIQYDEDDAVYEYGQLNGGGISGGSIYGSRLVDNTVTTAYTSNGINASLGYADYSNGVFNGWNKPTIIECYSVWPDNIVLAGKYLLGRTTIHYMQSDGSTVSEKVVTWSYY